MKILRYVPGKADRDRITWIVAIATPLAVGAWAVWTYVNQSSLPPSASTRRAAVVFEDGAKFSRSQFHIGGIVTNGCADALKVGGDFDRSSVDVGSVKSQGCATK
jgi:hypothetical protein